MAVTPCWKSLVARCTAPMPTSSCWWLIWAKLERRLGASLPRRCAYPSVCGYVSLMSTQKTATGCELTLDLRDDSGHRAPWHETSEIRAMAQLSLQYPDCLVESISSHCLRLIGTRSPEEIVWPFYAVLCLWGWDRVRLRTTPWSRTASSTLPHKNETVMIALG